MAFSPYRILIAALLLPAALGLNPGFPYGSQKVRGVNLGGWLVLEVSNLSPAMLSHDDHLFHPPSRGSRPVSSTKPGIPTSSTSGPLANIRTRQRQRLPSKSTGIRGSPRETSLTSPLPGTVFSPVSQGFHNGLLSGHDSQTQPCSSANRILGL
jgi:hypothetical protein